MTEAVPWARHDSDFTNSFEDAVALLAQQTSKTAVAVLTGISGPTVGNIAERVVAEHLDPDRLRGIKRIAVDEISFRKRHRYLTVVTDHDSRKVIWVAEGKSSDVLKSFFTQIGADACEAIEIATIDMSAAYREAILSERITNGLAEGVNNKIRLLSHRAFGFHSAPPLIATIFLCCGGITLPDLQLL